MNLIGFSEFFQLYNARFLSDSPWHDLFCMFSVIGFEDCPAAMRAIVTAPFKMMQIACRVDFPDDCVAITSVMWGFN